MSRITVSFNLDFVSQMIAKSDITLQNDFISVSWKCEYVEFSIQQNGYSSETDTGTQELKILALVLVDKLKWLKLV